MAVVQDAFFIPDDIATGLATGLYRRIGSVVRYATGPNKGHRIDNMLLKNEYESGDERYKLLLTETDRD